MNSRRNFVKTGIFGGSLLSITPTSGAITKLAKTLNNGSGFTLTILHTSDITSRSGLFSSSKEDKNIEHIIPKIKRIRKDDNAVILLNSGNLFESNSPNIRFLEKACKIVFDATVPGSEEVNSGVEKLDELREYYGLSIVSTDGYQTNLPEWKTVYKGPFKIGIVGIGPSKIKDKSGFKQTVELINNTSSFLKKNKKCDLIICISYNDIDNKEGIENDLALAKLTEHIDVIISGNNKASKKITRVISNKNKSEVLVASSGGEGKDIGRIDITFNSEKQKRFVNMSHISDFVA